MSDPEFRRELGFFDATMVVVGIMVGSGVFLASSDMMRDLGSAPWLMLAWLATGAMTMAGALSYGELAAMMPGAGGQYVYLREAFGRLGGFLFGWVMFLIIGSGSTAAIAVAFAKYLGELAPALGTGNVLASVPAHVRVTLPLPWLSQPLVIFARDTFTLSAGQLVGAALILGLTIVNTRGLRYGKWLQNVFTVAKVAALVALIACGVAAAVRSPRLVENLAAPWSAITTTARYADVRGLLGGSSSSSLAAAVIIVFSGALVGSLFAADGWNYLTFVAGEVRSPQRNLPRAIIGGTLAVTVLYLLVNLTYLATLPALGSPTGATPLERGVAFATDDRVASVVMNLVAPGWGGVLMALAVLVAMFGCLNGTILTGARLYYAMAHDRLFFAAAGRLNGRGVPGAGLWIQAVWAVALVFSGTFNELMEYVVFALLLFYFLTILGLMLLRRRQPERPRPYRVPLYPIVPLFYLAAALVLMVSLLIVKPIYTWPGLIVTLSGLPVFVIWEWRARRTGRGQAVPPVEDIARSNQSQQSNQSME